MKDIAVADVRNFVLVGHTGSGKTTLVDALLYKLGVNNRLGSPEDGSSMADWTDEEKGRKVSVWAKAFDALYRGASGRTARLVFLDTPGYADFYGQVIAATAVADAALVVVDATSGLQVGTHRVWRRCEELGLPRAIAITGLDKEHADFWGTLQAVRQAWGARCQPVAAPRQGGAGVADLLAAELPADVLGDAEALRNSLIEAAAETDDALIEKYLGGEPLSEEELTRGLRAAVRTGKLIPVWPVAAKRDVGVAELLEGIARWFPSPVDVPRKDAEGQPVTVDPEAPLVAQVWRSVNDPFVGQLTFLRVFGGTLRADSEVFNATKKEKERIGTLYFVNGRKQDPVPEAQAGDVVAIAKLKHTAVNDTLCAASAPRQMPAIAFPQPVMAYAVAPKTQGDEDKLSTGLLRLAEEDPTLHVERNTETRELILSGMGDMHLDVAVDRLKARSNVDVVLSLPKVAYKETVTAKGEGHYKHKKQTGGRGQYGEVYLRVEPRDPNDPEWFVDEVVGGVIPSNFMPAVQKGLLEGMARGAVAGYPVINVRVTVYDGSYHEVDSSEISFKIAAARAFRDGMLKAKPVLLEPIMRVKIMVPEQFMGDITGDLNQKRGRILGLSAEDGVQVITAEVPQAEMFQYCSQLRSITGGRGSFEMEFARYEIVPANIAQKIIAEAQKAKEEEE